MHADTPHRGALVALGAPHRPPVPRPPLPTLSERWNATLGRARAPRPVVGDRLPQIVKDASKPGRALLTQTCERAIDWLASNPRVPLVTLYALAVDLITHVRARRGAPVPDLAAAMRAEEDANARLNLTQWCAEGPMTLGRLHALRTEVGLQIVTSLQLLQALDTEIARGEAPRLCA